MKPTPAIALLMVLGLTACQDTEQNSMPQTTAPLAAAPPGLEPQEATPPELPPPSQTNPPTEPTQ